MQQFTQTVGGTTQSNSKEEKIYKEMDYDPNMNPVMLASQELCEIMSQSRVPLLISNSSSHISGQPCNKRIFIPPNLYS